MHKKTAFDQIIKSGFCYLISFIFEIKIKKILTYKNFCGIITNALNRKNKYWDIAKLVKAQDFDSCISLVRVQLSQPIKALHSKKMRSFIYFIYINRILFFTKVSKMLKLYRF